MDDIKNPDNENIIKGLDEDDIKAFESGEDDELFGPGREDDFEEEGEVDFFEVNGETDEFEDEMEPDFENEIVYSSAEKKKGFFKRNFQLPHISAGWLGVLLVALILMFILIPKSGRKADNGEMAAIDARVKTMEEQMIHLESLIKRVDLLSLEMQKQQKLETRIDQFEKSLASLTEQLQKEVESLKKQRISSAPPMEVEIPTVKKAAKPVERKVVEPTQVQYHIVKKGENLYRIALRYGLTEAQLLEINNMKPNAIIYPGQKIKVSR